MPKSIRNEATQEPLDEEERELMDPESWDWAHAEELPPMSEVLFELPIELTRDEYRIIGRAADAQGMTTHAFIAQVALAVAQALDPRRHPAA
jgi:hypothetical protein